MSFVDEHKDRSDGGLRWGVESICRVLVEHGWQIAPATYYAAKVRPPSKRALRDQTLKAQIAGLHADNYGVYGVRKMHAVLRRGGEAAARVLMRLGFRPLGELGIPQRWAFAEPAHFSGTNTYVTIDGCLSLRNHLAVREVLRVDAALRDEYTLVKKRLAATARDIDEYGRGKNAVLHKILAAAGMTDAERASIGRNQVPPHDEVRR